MRGDENDHVDPRLLADENASFGTPADLFIIPDHYVFRMWNHFSASANTIFRKSASARPILAWYTFNCASNDEKGWLAL